MTTARETIITTYCRAMHAGLDEATATRYVVMASSITNPNVTIARLWRYIIEAQEMVDLDNYGKGA